MFKKNLKLSCTAIGLVAVLLMGLTVPGATQQVEMPTRGQIATLTASEGDIFDVENTAFISHPRLTSAYIPLYPSSRSWRNLVKRAITGEKFGAISIGTLYLENDLAGLKMGMYTLKIDDASRLIAVDPLGNEFVIGSAKCNCERKIVDKPGEDKIRVQQLTVHEAGNPAVWKIIVVDIVIYKLLTDDDGNTCNCYCSAGGSGG